MSREDFTIYKKVFIVEIHLYVLVSLFKSLTVLNVFSEKTSDAGWGVLLFCCGCDYSYSHLIHGGTMPHGRFGPSPPPTGTIVTHSHSMHGGGRLRGGVGPQPAPA